MQMKWTPRRPSMNRFEECSKPWIPTPIFLIRRASVSFVKIKEATFMASGSPLQFEAASPLSSLPFLERQPIGWGFALEISSQELKENQPTVYLFRMSSTNCEAPKEDRKSTRLNSSHLVISYAVFCLKKKNQT